ncbi:ankyrin [Karstenula rhodostoma CBS 690.94]|uniref:protein S-acyltransferase n=1 Tax=Karstenula rhodostoma CBS 690.94 TaxID=1392251 RepID=A0A9P4PUH5_9PLEO|nr:ankyrin [Karstenula rhodostoma CBS 690.94]
MKVKLMVQKSVNLNAHALLASIKIRLVDVLETLLAAGMDPNMHRLHDDKWEYKHAMGYTRTALEEYPLWVAATQHGPENDKLTHEERETRDNSVKMVGLLLAHGADPFATFKSRNPSHMSEHVRSVINETKDSVLISVEELDAEPEFQKVSILHDLLEHGNLVHPILEMSNLDPHHRDSRGRTVLHAASLSRVGIHAPIDVLLFGAGQEVEGPRQSAPSFLHHLSSIGTDKLAVDNQGRNILHLMLVAANGHLVSCHPILWVLPLLSEAEITALTTQADVYGNTPLHLALRYAILRRDASPVEALLEAGADPFAQDNRGNTALHILAYRVAESEAPWTLFTKMLELGLDINTRNSTGQTPIFNLNRSLPVYIGHVGSARAEYVTPAQALALFEDAGADLFARDKHGAGLLHVAAQLKQKEFPRSNRGMRHEQMRVATRFELLVNKGLDVAMEDEKKRTALDVAAAYDNQSVLKLFDKDNVRNKVTAAELEEVGAEYDSDDMGF